MFLQRTTSTLPFLLFLGLLWSPLPLQADEKKDTTALTNKADLPPTSATKEDASPLALTARYLVHVHDKIQKAWDIHKLPLMDVHKRSATITLWLDAQGKLQKVKIVQASGLEAFDNSLLKAVYKASPFDKPHPSILEDTQKNGLDIVFRRRVFTRKLKPLKLKHSGQDIVPNWTPGKPKK